MIFRSYGMGTIPIQMVAAFKALESTVTVFREPTHSVDWLHVIDARGKESSSDAC